MFTGDHVLPTITPSIGFELSDWGRPLADYLESLAAMRARPDAILMPAHGHPGGSLHDRVTELLTHHHERFQQIVNTVEQATAPVNGATVAGALLWTRRGRAFASLDPFNQMIAVCETMAHLDVLADRGQLVTAAEDDHPTMFFAA
jgi:glyoxylase-like metal-dependent hydrolase (beta-lactamase superfamily II)